MHDESWDVAVVHINGQETSNAFGCKQQSDHAAARHLQQMTLFA